MKVFFPLVQPCACPQPTLKCTAGAEGSAKLMTLGFLCRPEAQLHVQHLQRHPELDRAVPRAPEGLQTSDQVGIFMLFLVASCLSVSA